MRSIVLKHKVNNSDHGETIEVEIFDTEYDVDEGFEIIETDKGNFKRSIEHSVSSPFGWFPA